MLVADVIVTFVGDLLRRRRIAQNDRADEDHQINFVAGAFFVLKQITKKRNIAEHGYLVDVDANFILNKTAEHNNLPIVHQNGRIDRALVSDKAGDGVCAQARYFLRQCELNCATFRYGRLDLKLQADILAFDSLERVGESAGSRRLCAGDKRHVLTDHYFRFFVVDGENVWRGKNVYVAVGFEGAGQNT